MVIPDIQPLNVNLQPNMPTVGVPTNADAVTAIGTGNKTDTFTNSDSSPSMTFQNGTSTLVTLSSDKKRMAEEENAERKPDKDQQDNQQKAASEHKIAMQGIPLYDGKLISVIKYPNGQSEMFDAFTGKRITQEDLALVSFLQGPGKEQVLTFESATSYSNMSAAEIYQQIQEMLHNNPE
ncbi:hypothetical protein [Brenneria izbisi]|uniref:Uncharacterized protein n=1 Tax=Brenneria izbisi TaxID=2939450 RepID=A0AA41XZ73_9GAMM|nr:hypothetical protein [Brenneria izbisi]MCV9879521.1 hypothetical protein [Brenneria izbisi]MCV9882910.1 hypothetical protein [Brenneria izbisi]